MYIVFITSLDQGQSKSGNDSGNVRNEGATPSIWNEGKQCLLLALFSLLSGISVITS